MDRIWLWNTNTNTKEIRRYISSYRFKEIQIYSNIIASYNAHLELHSDIFDNLQITSQNPDRKHQTYDLLIHSLHHAWSFIYFTSFQVTVLEDAVELCDRIMELQPLNLIELKQLVKQQVLSCIILTRNITFLLKQLMQYLNQANISSKYDFIEIFNAIEIFNRIQWSIFCCYRQYLCMLEMETSRKLRRLLGACMEL
jgi:hypothetical protein